MQNYSKFIGYWELIADNSQFFGEYNALKSGSYKVKNVGGDTLEFDMQLAKADGSGDFKLCYKSTIDDTQHSCPDPTVAVSIESCSFNEHSLDTRRHMGVSNPPKDTIRVLSGDTMYVKEEFWENEKRVIIMSLQFERR